MRVVAPDGSSETAYDFAAFISYKHVVSSDFARDFELAIKRFGRSPFQRPLRIFRDEQYIVPGDDLGPTIDTALRSSEYLILLASPEAAASPWVRKELELWCGTLGRASRLLVVLTSGRIAVDENDATIDWSETDALPDLLQRHMAGLPVWADATAVVEADHRRLENPAYQKVVTSMAAALANIEPNKLIGREWQIRRRNIRLVATIAVVLACLVVGLAVVGTNPYTSLRTSRSREFAATSRLQARGERLLTAARAVEQEATTEAVRALLDAHASSRSLVWEQRVNHDAIESLAVAPNAIWVAIDDHATTLSGTPTRSDAKLVAAAPDGTIWTAGKALAAPGQPSSRLPGKPTELAACDDQVVVMLADGRVMRRSSTEPRLDLVHKHDGMPTSVGCHDSWIVSTALEPDAPVMVWHPDLGTRTMPEPPFSANAASISPDGLLVAIAFEDGTVGEWALPSFEERERARLQTSASAAAWSPDGHWLAFGDSAGSVLVVDRKLGAELSLSAVDGGVWAMAWRNDTLVTAGSDGYVRAWRPHLTVGPIEIHARRGEDRVVARSYDDRHRLVDRNRRHVFVVEGKPDRVVGAPTGCRFREAEITPDGSLAAIAWWPLQNTDNSCSVLVYDLSGRSWPMPDELSYPKALSFDGQAHLAAVGSVALGAGLTLAVWSARDARLIHKETLSREPIETTQVIDANTVYLGGLRGTLTMFQFGGERRETDVPVGSLRDIFVLPDESVLTTDVDGLRWFTKNLDYRGVLVDTSGGHTGLWDILGASETSVRARAQTGEIYEVSLDLDAWMTAAREKVRE